VRCCRDLLLRVLSVGRHRFLLMAYVLINVRFYEVLQPQDLVDFRFLTDVIRLYVHVPKWFAQLCSFIHVIIFHHGGF